MSDANDRDDRGADARRGDRVLGGQVRGAKVAWRGEPVSPVQSRVGPVSPATSRGGQHAVAKRRHYYVIEDA